MMLLLDWRPIAAAPAAQPKTASADDQPSPSGFRVEQRTRASSGWVSAASGQATPRRPLNAARATQLHNFSLNVQPEPDRPPYPRG